ncbi:MAG: hypothetical protein ACI8W3_003441 [Myxococcota bacterium]|jgi:hypothetical protein
MQQVGSSFSLLRWLGVITAAFALALGVVLTGVLDRFSGAGGLPRDITTQSVALYWALCSLTLVLVYLWQTKRAQLLAALISLAISLAFFEVAARVLEIPAGFLKWDGLESRTNHHIYAPNRTMYAGIYEDEPVFVITNEDGLRSDYSAEVFRTFGTRIAILGDSFTFGFGVQQENSMPTNLEAQLRDALGRTDLAVLNAGIVSYAPLLEKLLYGNVVATYKPQLVMLMLDPTDIGDDFKYGQEAVDEAGRTVFPRAGPECGEDGVATYHGAVAEILKPVLSPLLVPLTYPLNVIGPRIGIARGKNCDYNYYDFNLDINGTIETNRYFHYRHPLEATREYFDASFAHIRETAAAVRRNGAEFVLIVSPRFHHWNAKESPNNWEHEDYSLSEAYQYEYFRYFEQARETVDFPIFDLLPAFQATDDFPLVFSDDPHWNPRGNAFAAKVLTEYLVGQGLVPNTPGPPR